MQYTLTFVVTIKATSAADATALKTLVGDGSAMASAIEAAIITAAADPTSPLFGAEIPTVTATAATVATASTGGGSTTPAPGSATPAATTAPTDSASSAVLAGALVALSGAALILA